MERRRTSLRRVALLASLVAVAAGLTGCGQLVGPSPAASVNGTEISQDDLNEMIEGYRDLVKAEVAARADQQSQQQGSQVPADQVQAQIDEALAPYQRTRDTYSTDGAAMQLTELIKRQLFEDAVDRAGAKVTDADREQAEATLKEQYPSWADAPDIVRDTYVATDAATLALRKLVPKELEAALAEAGDRYEADLLAAYQAQVDSLVQICGPVLGTADEASATAAAERIRGGEDAAAVADDVSVLPAEAVTDPTCVPAAQAAQIFGSADARRGDVLGPVEQDGQWLLLVADSVAPQPFEELRDQIASSVPDRYSAAAEQDIREFLTRLVSEDADVEVNPQFGRWSEEQVRVVPPKVPSAATTTTTTATTVPGSTQTIVIDPAATGS